MLTVRALPGSGAVLVENVKVVCREKFASVNTGLNGAKASENANLFDIAHDGHNVQSLRKAQRMR